MKRTYRFQAHFIYWDDRYTKSYDMEIEGLLNCVFRRTSIIYDRMRRISALGSFSSVSNIRRIK